MSILVAEKISKKYENIEVLKEIDFKINKGEMVAIVGKSGAGKSSFLQVISTLDFSNNGHLYYDGKEIIKSDTNFLYKFRNNFVGFIFQDHYLLPEFTALENVLIPGLIANRNYTSLKENAKHWLIKLGLESRQNHLPSQLSGGEQQRVAAVRAFINEPNIIFADEPTGNLDEYNSELIENSFFELNQKNKTSFIIVTHNLSLAKKCHKIYKLENGKIYLT